MRARIIQVLLAIAVIIIALSESLSAVKNPLVLIGPILLLISGLALIRQYPWARKLFIFTAWFYIIQGFFFIGYAPHLNLTEEQTTLLPSAIMIRTGQILFFTFFILIIPKLESKKNP